ncbi:MAG: HAD-IB family hydrolase [Thiotrichales bacterium]|nr:HAD-IB family hydrolase [Thiotrichales bacterium]
MKIALFDLDNTLIAGDSDYLWGEYLCEQGHVDAQLYHAGHDRYYQDYLNGVLNVSEFLQFQLGPLAGKSACDLAGWQEDYIDTKIKPIILDAGRLLIDKHRKQGHTLIIITATNRFLTQPVARLLQVDELIATEPGMDGDVYTGKPVGTPAYREGKVSRLEQWLDDRNINMDESWFYSDSHNDIPLLEYVDHPTAVDPDETLRETAEQRGWPVITLRNDSY